MMVSQLVWVRFMVPETKGVPLEDIEHRLVGPKVAKALFDEVDTVLARHYGFTDEELDFILNYDIKYRLGQDAEQESQV